MAGLTLFRLWAAATIPLTEDEAYYRLWAMSPQFGYLDHPPMIAWWIHAGRLVAGDTPLGVRLFPVLSSLATSLLLFDLAQALGWGAAIAARAALWCNATLLIGVGAVLAVPDAASVPFWTLALCCLARVQDDAGPRWWAAAGCAAGLACLSKYSALFLAPGVVLWLLLSPGGLKALRRPGPWLAVLIAAAIFSLNVIWNAEHHWITFIKQFGRVAPGRFAPRYLIELLAGQALLLNPLITVFVGRALAMKRQPPPPNLSLPLATAAPFAAYLLLHALHDRVQAHWPVPIYPALALCAAAAAEQATGPALVGLRRGVVPLGFLLSVLTLLHLALPSTDLKGGKDPAAPLRGWPAFAQAVERQRQAAGAAWVGAYSYGTTAELADQTQIAAPVAELIDRERYPAADPSWRADLSRPGLVIDLQRRLSAQKLQACFNEVTALSPLGRGVDPGANGRYAVFRVAGPRADVLQVGCPGRE